MKIREIENLKVGDVIKGVGGTEYEVVFIKNGEFVLHDERNGIDVYPVVELSNESYELKKPEPKCLGEVAYLLSNNGVLHCCLRGEERHRDLRHDFLTEVEIKEGKVYEL